MKLCADTTGDQAHPSVPFNPIVPGRWTQVWEDNNLPGLLQSSRGNPEPPLESKTNSRRYATCPTRACPGWPAEGNQGSAPVGGRNCPGGQQEARRPLATSSLPSSTRAGTYLRSEHLVPSLKSLFKAQGLKTRKVRDSVDLWPSHMALSGARLNPLGEHQSEHQHTLHIVSLALLPRMHASRAARTPGLNAQAAGLAFPHQSLGHPSHQLPGGWS